MTTPQSNIEPDAGKGEARNGWWWVAYLGKPISAPVLLCGTGSERGFYVGSNWILFNQPEVTFIAPIPTPEQIKLMRKALESLIRWDDVTSNENYDISSEGEQDGLFEACQQARFALAPLSALTPSATEAKP